MPPDRPVIPAPLRPLLNSLFLLFALLAVNAFYLGSVTLIEYVTGELWQDALYLLMFLAHLILGLVVIPVFIWFGFAHLWRAIKRDNRDAVHAGLGLFFMSWLILISGLVLTRFEFLELNDPTQRQIAYWLHILTPFLAAWLFVLHRLAGHRIRWRKGLNGCAAAMVLTLALVGIHWISTNQSPDIHRLEPSFTKVKGSTDGTLPAAHLDTDGQCAECHQDIAEQHALSMHRQSSFNNPAYRFSIEDTRKVVQQRDDNVQATRLCATCHDTVPLFSGAFDHPGFDADHPDSKQMAQAGITCMGCHAMASVDSPRGNGDYTMIDPPRYPFAFSDNPLLKALNHQLIKAKPAFHKHTLLKPFHKSAEFCSTCHKVALPYALNHYRWLRGQNHYDSFRLSGVSGHRVDSFYYPPKAVKGCAQCHMPATRSDDPAARDLSGSGQTEVHHHGFAAANTAVPALKGETEQGWALRQAMLKDSVRIDLFGLREQGNIDGRLHAPLDQNSLVLQPGQTYLLETVVRTLKLGHHLTQGTTDSNQLWLEISLREGDQILAHSGGLDAKGRIDPWAYFLNNYLLDRNGQRIDHRNAQDIFVTLYTHQIPPGAAATIPYRFTVPETVQGPLTLEARLHYRKFDSRFLRHVLNHRPLPNYAGDTDANQLPITTLAETRLELPVGAVAQHNAAQNEVPDWERWNDYGIGLLRKGRAQLRQAEQAFQQVEALVGGTGAMNQVRALFREGRLEQASQALSRASQGERPAPAWTQTWYAARIDHQVGNLDQAREALESLLDTRFQAARDRGFDFSIDHRVQNELGKVLYDMARRYRGDRHADPRTALLQEAKSHFEATLNIDPENADAHYNLARIYQQLGNQELADHHRQAHETFRPDDQAVAQAVARHRHDNPVADHAAEPLAIYALKPSPYRQEVARFNSIQPDHPQP